MRRRRRAMPCEWQWCDRTAVGYRRWWRNGTLFLHWLCRRHQRRYDHGVHGRRREEVDLEAFGR